MNYKKWVRRAEKFVLGLPKFAGLAPLDDDSDEMHIEAKIAKPLSEKAVARLEKEMNLKLPERLKRFLLEGSGSCHFSYVWDVPKDVGTKISFLAGGYFGGGAEFCNTKEMPETQEWYRSMAQDISWVSENKKEQKIWRNAIPLVYMENGDHLALDLTKDKDDPPVIYLGDTDGHKIISPNFDEFLRHWEGICYLGPESWLIDKFFDRKKRLNANNKKAAQVREFFGIKDWE